MATIDTTSIDVTKPTEVEATTQSVRDNFSAIKTELAKFENGESVDLTQVAIGELGTEGAGINVNGTTYDAQLKVSDIGNTHLAEVVIHRHSTTYQPLLLGARSNSDDETHANVTNGQALFSTIAAGWTGTHYDLFGESKFTVGTGTVSATSSPGKWTLALAPDGSNTLADVITADSDKSVVFTGSVSANAIDGTPIGGTTPAAGAFTALTSNGIDDNADATTITIDASENIGIGVASLENWGSIYTAAQIGGNSSLIGTTTQAAGGIFHVSQNAYNDGIWKYISTDEASNYYQQSGEHIFRVAASGTLDTAISWKVALTIDSGGVVYQGPDNNPSNNTGNNPAWSLGIPGVDGTIASAAYQNRAADFNRLNDDGTIINLRQDGVIEGTVSVSGTTVSYNGAHLSRWSQWADGPHIVRPEVLRGTVLSNCDEMCEWMAVEFSLDEVTKHVLYGGQGNIGDTIDYDYEGVTVQASIVQEENEQLNKMLVSSVAGDRNVAGVFQAYDEDDSYAPYDFYCAMTGDFVIRIGSGVTVERGDLLESAGDGTARPQADDLVRSCTVAKVTSASVTETYPDGSYLVPCVLMAC